MDKMSELFNGVTFTAWLSGILYGLFGDKSHLALILLGFVAVDFITGIVLAYMGKSKNTKHGGFSSEVCFRGLIKKSLIMVVILVAIGVDKAMGGSNILRDAVLLFFIANEGLSILESVLLSGQKLPPQLKNALEKMYTKDDERRE